MDERYERTIAISCRIKSQGYRLTEIWECEFDRLLKGDVGIAEYVKNHPMVRALNHAMLLQAVERRIL